MASLPVNKIIPSTLQHSRNRTIRCQKQHQHQKMVQPAGAVSPAAKTAPASSSSSVDSARLEPRVEERDGFWVLKEKFRAGINPAEKVKIEKDPMKLFIENGISELASLSMEQVDQSKDSKDDVDVRLKWLGLFHRRKHHCKFFFMYVDNLILITHL